MKKIFLSCGFALLIIANVTTSKAQDATQKNGLLKTAHAFINAYNTGDTAKYHQFLSQNQIASTEIPRLLGSFRNTFNSIGKIEAKDFTYLSPTTIKVAAQENKYEFWWLFTINTDQNQQFKSRTVMPLPFPAIGLQSGKIADAKFEKELDDYITQKLGASFAGNVWISENGKWKFQRSYGKDHKGLANTAATAFGLASVGKMFTAISVLQLKDQKKLKLEDQVGLYLPELKNKKVAALTLAQLLTHTSGMGDFFESPLFAKLKDSLTTPKNFMPFFEADELNFEPGKEWRYSNSGFSLLSLIIEKVSGSSFKDYVAQHIFKVAKMENSVVGLGAGGGTSTSGDMMLFLNSLEKNQLLSKATTDEFLNYTVDVNENYGYGTEHHRLGSEHIVGHSGSVEEENNEINFYPNLKYKVIILSNTPPPIAHYVSNKIKGMLIRK